MNTRKTLLGILLFALIFAAWSPVLAASSNVSGGPKGTTRLWITNRTKSPMLVILNGPNSYRIEAPPGNSNYYIPNGLYTYQYTECGMPWRGALLMNGGFKALGGLKCVYANQLVKNNTGENLQIKLDGINSTDRFDKDVPYNTLHYNFKLTPGNSRIKVLKARYRYTTTGCGGKTKTGTIYLRGNIQAWSWECKDGTLTVSTHK